MSNVLQIIGFITTYGLPAFQKIVEMSFQTTPPTQEQWDAVFALANKSYDDYVKGTPTSPTAAS
jgi:hypothetical protein